MSTAALQLRTDTATMMPAMSVQDAVERYGQLVQFVGALLKVDIDYGQIPGTNKPTLLKPGAEKLLTFFGLSKRFAVLEKVEDWTGTEHGGPFFYYMYRCALYNGDQLIAESDGSCNSHESKYRWRKAERECPSCGKAAIIKGKEEYGGGWVCFKKKDGCGAKFRDGDAAIESQQSGRVANPDIADQVNTIQKMAQKRALIAATLLAVNASEFFTQDLEDMVIDAEVVEARHQPTREAEPEPVRPVRFEGAQSKAEAPTTWPEDRQLAWPQHRKYSPVFGKCRALGWAFVDLANYIQLKFKLAVSDDPVDALDALSALQLKELDQALAAEFNNRR